MTIKKDLSSLPRADSTTTTTEPGDGWPPNGGHRIAGPIMEWWMAHRREHRPKAVDGTRFRGSDAGMCARRLGYVDIGAEQTNPRTWADNYRMDLGTLVHDHVELIVPNVFEHVVVEPEVDYRPDLDGSGHGDFVVTFTSLMEGRSDTAKMERVHVEVKTVNGFKYRNMTGSAKKAPAGPPLNHVLQGCLNAKNDNADQLVLLYFSMENTGKYRQGEDDPNGLGLFTGEWVFERDEIERIAAAETERLNLVYEAVDAGLLPERMILLDDGRQVRIDSPATNLWVQVEDDLIVDNGRTWVCDYCAWRDRCISDGPGLVSISASGSGSS